MLFIAYAFKGQVHVFAGQVKIVSHLSCRTSAVLIIFCPLCTCINIQLFYFVYLQHSLISATAAGDWTAT